MTVVINVENLQKDGIIYYFIRRKRHKWDTSSPRSISRFPSIHIARQLLTLESELNTSVLNER